MEKISIISTAVIAFSTVMGIMGAFYYNLTQLNYGRNSIILFELLLVVTTLVFIYYVGGKINE